MAAPRAAMHNGATCVGWRHETLIPEPGPPPRRPTPPERPQASDDWAAARRRDEARTNRPLLVALGALAGIALLSTLLWPLRVLPGIMALGAVLACVVVGVPVVVALLQGRRVMAECLAEERRRLREREREQEAELRERQQEHARRYAEWQGRKRAYEAQPRWYSVRVPDSAGVVTVAGGTDAGWSAVLTTIGASRLRAGGDLTVVDLSGRAVAGDLAALVKRSGVVPRVWVLPADLPRMNLGTNLDARQRARILAAVALAAGPGTDDGGDPDDTTDAGEGATVGAAARPAEPSARDTGDTEGTEDTESPDEALLRRVFEVLGARSSVAAVIGGLRALAADGDGADTDDPSLRLLSPAQRKEVRDRCGDDRSVVERAWELERRLSAFEGVGTRTADESYAQVKVIAVDRALGEAATRAYGSYTVAALGELLELRAGGGATGELWAHVIVVCGADVLPADAVDRLISSATSAGVGLVLTFREVGAGSQRWLDGDACFPLVMRPSGTPEATRLAEWLGGSARLRMHRLTEVIGEALDDEVADSYVEDTAEGVTAPHAMRNAAASVAPLDLVRHMKAATVWGRTTAQAEGIGDTDDDGRLRELSLDAHTLRTLPATAMVLPGADGPVLADANPGILTLPTATLSTVEEAPSEPVTPAEPPAATGEGDDPPPNLGPPPERLDWRAS